MENVRDFVNGAQLQRFVNKKISIIGFVTEVAPNGLTFDLRAVDNQVVKITLKRPLDQPLTGYVQVNGISQGKSVIADNFILFNNENFDTQSHNTLCSLLYSIPNIYDIA